MMEHVQKSSQKIHHVSLRLVKGFVQGLNFQRAKPFPSIRGQS